MSAAARAARELSPETWALLACAQAVLDDRRLPAFRAAVAACPSAERLCGAAVAHGMVGHLHRLVAAQPDASFAAFAAEPLAKLYRVSAERNLRQTAELLRLLERLRQRGVEAMPIKGPAWAEALYGDVTLRNWVDLDVLVRHEHVAVVREVLLATGFGDHSAFHARLLAREACTEGELHFESAERDIIDVHWQVGVGYSAEALPAGRLLARARPRTLLGREVVGPNPADMLLMTCLHGTRHRWDGVETLLALAVQVRDLPTAAWPGILAVAGDAGCLRRAAVGVAHACRVLGLPCPHEVKRVLAHDRTGRALLVSLKPDSLDRGEARGGREELAVLLWTFAGEDSAWRAAEHAALRGLRPGPADWQAVELPAWAACLYYPLRMIRLAAKWATRLLPQAPPDDAQ